MQAVILAGGFGTRLKSVINDIPKSMAPIGDKPFLEFLYEYLSVQIFDNFIFLTGYKSEVIEKHFIQENIIFSKENNPLGTAGALFNAWDDLENEFYLINGDTFFSIDYKKFYDFIKTKNANACMALYEVKQNDRYGKVIINKRNLITSFEEKTKGESCFINTGICYFKKEALKEYYQNWDGQFLSLEKDVFPKFNNLYGLLMNGKFIDIGIPEDYQKAQTLISIRDLLS